MSFGTTPALTPSPLHYASAGNILHTVFSSIDRSSQPKMSKPKKRESPKLDEGNKKFKLPTEEEKRLIYEIYVLLCRSHFSLPKKRNLMTGALGYETWSWRVTGISEDAIRAIAQNNFNKPSKLLSRDHGRPRADTYSSEFFETIKSLEDWWDWVWESDKTTLMTNDEHNNRKVRSTIYPLDPKDNHFCSEVVGWHHTQKHEGTMIKKLIEDNGIDI
jgi:hypothetical protein